MKIFCFERDNQTQFTSHGPAEDTYMASFELFPFYEGSAFSLYKGLLNGKGPLRGEFCVVRTTIERAVDPAVWRGYLLRSAEASSLAAKFNKHIGCRVISFQSPMLTKIDTVSDFTFLFKCLVPHNKRLHLEEYVVLEPFIQGRFRRQFDFQPQRSDGDCSYQFSEDEYCEVEVGEVSSKVGGFSQWPNLAEAFSHFTWHATRSLVVCGLQGVFKDLVYSFANPTLHSADLQFGDTDRGCAAIAEFFAAHSCNAVCSKWEMYRPGHLVPPSVAILSDGRLNIDQVDALCTAVRPKRFSAFLPTPTKTSPTFLNRLSYHGPSDLINTSPIYRTPCSTPNDPHVHSFKRSWQKMISSQKSDEAPNHAKVWNKLVFPEKLSNQLSSEQLLPAKFHSQLVLTSKHQNQQPLLPKKISSQNYLSDEHDHNKLSASREIDPAREVIADGHDRQITDKLDDCSRRNVKTLKLSNIEASQSGSSEDQAKDPASYYSCNPAEPSRPLRRDPGYQISLV